MTARASDAIKEQLTRRGLPDAVQQRNATAPDTEKDRGRG